MKKVLALVLAFAMVFSSISFAFADTTADLNADAKTCVTLGMLKGSNDGVTPAYMAEASTRLQAAIMVLRLMGLEKEAYAYTSDKNFADMKDYAWADGKNAAAYLLAHPELGFIGDGVNFNANAKIDEASYYKVMLTAMGYKQTTAEVVGDYAWADVVTFAKSLGLAPQAPTTFTNNDIARITVEALKAKNKDGKVLYEALVAAGTLTAEAVAAAGLNVAAPVTVAVKAAKAIGNTVVEVEYTDAVDKAAAENVANYKVDGLEVKAAVLDGTKKVLVETAAQTAGKTYTLVVGDVKVNFGGKAKVTGTPELKKVTGEDTETVVLEFDKTLDFATAKDVANYTIAGVKIEKVAFNADRNKVTLTTSGLAANKTHTIKVTNIKSVDGVALKSASKSFYAKSDKAAPKVESVKSLTFKRILVTFNEELDKATAENVENYTIANLTVEKAELVEDADDELTLVELTTSAQKSGTTYSLKVKGVKDSSVLANEMTKEQTVKFTGKSEDKAGPTLNITKTNVLSRNKVLVQFEDASRLDFATVQNSANYEFDKDVTIEKVEMTPDYNSDTKTAVITVSDLAEKTYYKLTVTGVTDEYGNEIKKTTKTVNYTNVQLEAAKINKVVTKSSTEVRLHFSKYIDPLTAKDVANYTINGDIGTPVSAKVMDDLYEVRLKVNELVEGKEYKVTVKGVQDLAGNVLNTNSKFYGLTTKNDIDGPEILDVTVVNKNVLRVTFDEEISIVNGMTVKIDKIANALNLGAVYEDNTVLEFTNPAGFSDIEYRVTSFNNVKDLAGNKAVIDVNSLTSLSEVNFWGNTLEPEKIDFSWEQVNVEKYKLTFSEKVDLSAPGFATDDEADDLGMDTVWFYKNKVAVDKVAWAGDINTKFASKHVANNINNTDDNNDSKTTMTASIVDEEKPYIENVEAVYRDEIKVTFNEDLKKPGAYKITYYDVDGKEKAVSIANGYPKINGTDENVVNIRLSTRLESRFDYTLKVTSVAADLAGNPSEKDEEYSFMGTDLARPDNYITGVTFKNGTVATVALQTAISGITIADVKVVDENKNVLALTSVVPNTDNNKITITLTNTTFREDIDYTVTVKGITGSYTFAGIVTDDITIEEVKTGTVVTGVNITYSDMKDQDKVFVNSVLATQVNEKDDKNKDITPIAVNHFASTQTAVKTVLVERDGVALYFFVADGATAESNQTELNALEAKLAGVATSHKLTSNLVVGTLEIKKPFTLDLGGYTIDGDVEITANGLVTIKNGTIKGNVIANNVALDLTNDATIGNVTIENIKPNTFTNNGTVGAIVIDTTNAVGIVNTGTISSAIVVENAGAITIKSAEKIEVKNEAGKVITVNTVNVVADGTFAAEADNATIEKAVHQAVYAELESSLNDITVADIEAAVATGLGVAEAKNVTVTWTSNNAAVTFDSNNVAKVTKPAVGGNDVTVKLTATIKTKAATPATVGILEYDAVVKAEIEE